MRWAWVAIASFAMGGGIWSMHFVGMLAFEMGMPVAYDLGTTILSLCPTSAPLGQIEGLHERRMAGSS